MTWLLWFSLGVVVYVYAGYPLTMFLLSRVFPRPVRKGTVCPSVSIIISAHNEERNIEATLRNKLELQYPRDLLEIIVVSDASID